MNYYKFIVVLTVFFHLVYFTSFCQSVDSSNLVKVDYKIEKNATDCNLIITINISLKNDHLPPDIPQFNYSNNLQNENLIRKNKFHSFYNDLCDSLYNIVNQNTKINKKYAIPLYIQKIIDLINTDSLKLEAKRIFEEEIHISKVYFSENSNSTITNGVNNSYSELKFTYPILLDKNTKTKFLIPSYKIKYHNRNLITESKLIEIN